MSVSFPVYFSSPLFLAWGLGLAAIAVVVGARELAMPRASRALALVAMLLLALAAGGMAYHPHWPGNMIVMVDLSPSTRTASYRERRILETRIGQLLGGVPHRLSYFADGEVAALDGSADLADVSCERTVFSPPPADAVVLF